MSDFVHVRAVPALVEQRGPRQLTGRLVPYDVIADVVDLLPEGRHDLYREGFRRGAFGGQVDNGSKNKGVFTRIGLIHRHDGGLGYLGPFVGLHEEPDGLWGDVNVLPGKAEDVAELLRSGVDELSIEFRLPRGDNTVVDDDGVRWRTRAHLDQVALEPKGAYSTAQVLAFRAEVDDAAREQAELEAARISEEADRADAERALEAAAEIARARRDRWHELADRIDREKARQRELVETYGVTAPGGFRRA